MLGAARGWILTTEQCLELRQKVKNVGSTVPRNDKYASEPASAETQARGHRVILELYARRAPEDVLPRNFRLPDERPRFREGRRHAHLSGLSTGFHRRRGGADSLQHLLYSGQSRAESLSSITRSSRHKGRNSRFSDVSGAGPAFRTGDYFKGVAVLVAPGFGETGRGMFIHHCASANAAPILMRT